MHHHTACEILIRELRRNLSDSSLEELDNYKNLYSDLEAILDSLQDLTQLYPAWCEYCYISRLFPKLTVAQYVY